MSWLQYYMDEVNQFHPEFELIANDALEELQLTNSYEWKHHLILPGSSGIIPDYVLREKSTQKWVLAFEIKRTSRDVYSSRYQYQAKSYAEDNTPRYRANYPLYFALSNLEISILFAAKNGERPELCRIEDGFYSSGDFSSTPENVHKNKFKEDLKQLIGQVINTRVPIYENVWPGIISELIQHRQALPYDPLISIEEPVTNNWNLVRDYISFSLEDGSKTIFLLRCLMAEYLRGRLHYYGHPRTSIVPALNVNQNAAVNTIAALATIDFNLLFERAERYYTRLPAHILQPLNDYIRSITAPVKDISELAAQRNDAPIFLESFLSLIYPDAVHDGRGKIATDPELASILACLSIKSASETLIDPCCGDGPLLLAGYERKQTLGSSHRNAIDQIAGIEADPISVRLAALRLVMTSPANISPGDSNNIIYGDLFASSSRISEADVILMNPPFKRYEEQDTVRLPADLRNHYEEAIRQIKGAPPSTTNGQPNLFAYFIEYVAESMKEGARLAIILDNKWYHNLYGLSLRNFLLEKFEIKAIVEYPYNAFFREYDIATSVLVAEKKGTISADNAVKFIRSVNDPRSVNLHELSSAFHDGGAWPMGWSCLHKPQAELDARFGWKVHFVNKLTNDFRYDSWPVLPDLFRDVRRGSLQKEEGGLKVFTFPFTLTQFGPKRSVKIGGRPFETVKGEPLSNSENVELQNLARQIAEEFRGYALQNADDASGYELSQRDVTRKQCVEPPSLRDPGAKAHFRGSTRSSWTSYHNQALIELESDTEAGPYLNAISRIIGLNDSVLPKENLWVDLREPYAGELIIPRKTRGGHKVHVNNFALDGSDRQVRISSNFLSFSGCNALSQGNGLHTRQAVQLIAAFLLSSFGQLQYEIQGNNREGLLSMEEESFSQVKIFDPRWVRPERRQSIIDVYLNLPYPISNSLLSTSQPIRNQLDALFADEIINWQTLNLSGGEVFDKALFLNEVHEALDSWLIARQP